MLHLAEDGGEDLRQELLVRSDVLQPQTAGQIDKLLRGGKVLVMVEMECGVANEDTGHGVLRWDGVDAFLIEIVDGEVLKGDGDSHGEVVVGGCSVGS